MASGLKSDNSNLVLNADGAGNKVVFQENGVNLPESLTTNGYTKLPNGLMLQWMQVPQNGATSGTANFPIPFSTSVFIVNIGMANDTTGQGDSAAELVGTPTLTSFNWYQPNNGNASTFQVFAIGY